MRIVEAAYKWNGALTERRSTSRIILHHAAARSCTAQQVHSWHLANGWAGILLRPNLNLWKAFDGFLMKT